MSLFRLSRLAHGKKSPLWRKEMEIWAQPFCHAKIIHYLCPTKILTTMKTTVKMAFAFVFGLSLLACGPSPKSPTCHIKGKVMLPFYNGKKIYLVPLNGPRDAAHVDSALIRNQEFELRVDTPMLALVRVDYHFRDRAQDMLVVTEPGVVRVTMGPLSATGGTPQNDSLQVWKGLTENMKKRVSTLTREFRESRRRGDSVAANRALSRIDSAITTHAARSRQMGHSLGKGSLFGDFLLERFPEAKRR